MTKYLLLIILALGISLGLFVNKSINESNRADRMTENYQKSEDSNKIIVASLNELTKNQSNRIDELADSLNIKQKSITKYVKIKVKDSIPYPVETIITKVDSGVYEFSRDTACFSIVGNVSLLESEPIVSITKLTYDNIIEYLVYIERKQWQFLFIKSRLFGHKEVKLETISKCGISTTTNIELIKK